MLIRGKGWIGLLKKYLILVIKNLLVLGGKSNLRSPFDSTIGIFYLSKEYNL